MEAVYSKEFLISLFFNHLSINGKFDPAHIVLEKRKKTEVPIFLPAKDCNPDQMQSVSSLHDLVSSGQVPQSKVVLKKQQMVSYFNSQLSGLTPQNFDYEVLFMNIRPSRLVKLIEGILLEKKIILVHNNHGVLAVIIECLKSLIQPLKWCAPSSSFMIGPDSFEFMDSPFGYIYGFSRETWDRDIKINIDESQLDEYFFEDAVILEIDKDYLKTKLDSVIPPQKKNMLIEGIQKLLNSKDEMMSGFNQKYPHLYSLKYEQLFWKSLELHVKRLFLNFFITTINNYLGFYKSEEEIGDKALRADNIFDFERYVNAYPSEEKDFIKQLTMTQSFNHFIEKSYKSNCDGDTDIKAFICTIQLLEKDKFPTVDEMEKAYANPVKYDYDHCLKEYTNRLNAVLAIDSHLQSDQSKGMFEFIDKSKILEMPGIDYHKIEVYRRIKQKQKFTSMTNLPDPLRMESSSMMYNSVGNTFKKQKLRYKSI